MTDTFTRLIDTSSESEYVDYLRVGSDDVQEIHARCVCVYPDFDVSIEEFTAAIIRAVDKYLVRLAKPDQLPGVSEIRKFISELQCVDLYLTIGCARGDEQAWRRFDGDYRSLIERLARQLVGRGMDANEVIDSVYVELYGTEAVNGVRQSKFRTYTGRGTLRG